ncbi:hypothetical protein MNB_SV-10-1361 [hydrothermal vent metagenome]|uniref:Uncharacterized protein n=1 Tax=hydrothermal vent metagenome TaxID=652676 RepID=A0A1W1BWC7_9ZZZZ
MDLFFQREQFFPYTLSGLMYLYMVSLERIVQKPFFTKVVDVDQHNKKREKPDGEKRDLQFCPERFRQDLLYPLHDEGPS